jgi:biotin transport system substrate-specific component
MKTRYLILTALMAALTAAGSLIKIPAPLAPITLQFFFTLMSGALLGGAYGAFSQILYAFMGLLGLPIFSAGGGIGYILSATFGFILGFIAAAWVTGKLTEKRGALRLMAACLLGTAVMYVIAIAYMTVILNSYLGKNLEFGYILQVGMLIYLPGDLLKCLLCALLGSRLAPVLRYNT